MRGRGTAAKNLFLGLCAALAAAGRNSAAEGAGDESLQFFQEQARVLIATQHEQTPEEAPSIVTVVSRHEIEAYGARDLSDILRLIPGYVFGMDVFGQAGGNFRGIWVEEGKQLLMIDGIPQNELGYGNYTFFGTIPASMIEKVEIIRGPGSAIYGGFAEAAVINVVTLQAAKLNGMRVTGEAGAVGRGGSSRFGGVSYGSQSDALRVAAHVGYGTEPLSTRDYVDFSGHRLRLNQDTAYRRWQHVITEAEARNLTVRYQRASFTNGGQDAFTTVQAPVNGINQERVNDYNDVTHLDYKAKISDRLTLTPVLEYARNNTRSFPFPKGIDALYGGSGASLWRYRAELAADYATDGEARLKLGAGYIRDEIENVGADGTPGLQLSANPADVGARAHSASTFGLFQYLDKFGPVGLALGGRYEATSFGGAFAPRAGLTYVREGFNAKLLYGRAYRIPLPWQAFSRTLGFNGSLAPETADTAELELGQKLTRRWSGKVDVFVINIHSPIVFQGNADSYVNFGRIQSQGAEAELRGDYGRYGGFANFTFDVPGRGTSPGFVTGSKKQFLGSPPVKVDAGAFYRKGIFELAPSATFLAHRAGQSQASANAPGGMLATTDYPALVLANLNVIARGAAKGLDVHLAVHNIFATRYLLIQPYYGGHAPMPAQDREIDLGVTWRL